MSLSFICTFLIFLSISAVKKRGKFRRERKFECDICGQKFGRRGGEGYGRIGRGGILYPIV